MPASPANPANERRDQLLNAIEQLLALPAAELRSTMNRASQLISELFQAEKVDVFFLEPETQTLVALGVSDTPMGRKQKSLGLDRLQLANRGRIVEVFETGQPWHSGHQDEDPNELPGIKYGLGIRSAITAAIEIGGRRRGVLECSSSRPEYFSLNDLRFLEAVAKWIGMVAHRAELVEQLTKAAAEQGRRAAADELITILAHDIGNHLFSLRTRIELIHKRAQREQSTDYLRDAQAATRGLEALMRLTSDLLDVGRLDQGLFALRPQSVDLTRLVEEVAAAATTPRTAVQYRGPAELVSMADLDRLRQALSNLVANALKHSPTGTPVVVEAARQTRTDGTWAVLTVSDQGPGIPPHLLPRLFERFVRGPGSSGLGLGLYLARQIAIAHGGSLEVHSAPGKGTCFELAFPMDRDTLSGPVA
ncbi:GAF domain-containing sensor histidine kinase [Stigmatella sp. ncwal1]|uniref:histidine kinase n=1 Tax=Stigmatella ashevillensis TaxID=2995309 RepID=A0ABT5D4X6_9BACT|nr:GAF domain-containing sensor histidine kinase [Stigmatella ashevillena]MDC0708716.1 GAF domain-containing sensor histidine kinase [Stigmatella ashevillena]